MMCVVGSRYVCYDSVSLCRVQKPLSEMGTLPAIQAHVIQLPLAIESPYSIKQTRNGRVALRNA